MTNIGTSAGSLAVAGSGLSIPYVDGYAYNSAAIAKGAWVCVPAANQTPGTTTQMSANASATQAKGGIPVVAEEASTAFPARVRVCFQGRVQALVKSTANNAIEVGDRLCAGSAQALDADAPAVNTRRWIAYADEAVAAGSSSTASLRWVVLIGHHGLGLQAYTNATGIGT